MSYSADGTQPHLCLVADVLHHSDGQGRVNYEVAKAALARGYRLTLLARVCAEDLVQNPNASWVATGEISVPTQLARNLFFAHKSAAWLRAHRAKLDLIQVNGFITWEPADVVAVHYVHTAWLKSRTFPFRWRSFSPYAWYQRSLTILNGFFERRTFRAARVLIAVSGFTRGEILALGIPPERVLVVHNGVDTAEFRPLAPDEPDERASFNLPEGVPIATFVGDIRTTRKNLDAVLKAMQALPELHLAVAGKLEGSPYPALAAALGVADRVHFVGKTSRIPNLMRSVDLFVFPSRYEAHPLVILEAMASGLPIIVSDAFQAGDYVGHGGLVYGDPDDIPALTAALRCCLSEPEALDRMSRAARRQALELQWSRCAEGYLKIYERLLAEKKRT